MFRNSFEMYNTKRSQHDLKRCVPVFEIQGTAVIHLSKWESNYHFETTDIDES